MYDNDMGVKKEEGTSGTSGTSGAGDDANDESKSYSRDERPPAGGMTTHINVFLYILLLVLFQAITLHIDDDDFPETPAIYVGNLSWVCTKSITIIYHFHDSIFIS